MKKTTQNLFSSIKKMFSSLFAWAADHKVWSIIILAIIFGGLYFYLKPANSTGKTEEITVIRKNLEEAVSLTGRVKPTEEAVVTFEKSGTVRSVFVKVGDKVVKGQNLASISADDAYARVAESKASLDAAVATLDELNSGAKPEQIDLKKTAIARAENDVEQGYRNIDDSLRNISTTGNDVVRNTFSKVFDGGYVEGYRINIASCDSVKESQMNTLRKDAEDAIRKIDSVSNNYAFSTSRAADVDTVKTNSLVINNFLNTARNLYATECITKDTRYDAMRISVTAAKNSWSGVSSDFSNKINAVETLKISLKQANEDLRLSQSGEKSQRVRAQEAQVEAARARLNQSGSDAAKNVLRSPFTGIVTAIDIKAGEFASVGGAKSISLISDAAFEIESKVSEIDVAKIKINDKAQITFDAYGQDEKFEASITNISPAGVITDGVPTYKTIFSFAEKSDKVRSGMTANIDVVTKVYENVISIPARAVKNVKGEKKVKVLTNKAKNTVEEKVVKTGARGVNGEIEIKEGVNVNDIIVIEIDSK